MTYTELHQIDTNKIKSESELIFFIKNKISDRIPNYSLLLGAGCSVTSDIGTGVDLVQQWKREYFKLKFGCDDYSEDKLSKHLENESTWYKKGNEYSSFFEKIYHLPVQRRKFIQSQVDGKIPSIGYTYLVSLCDKNNKYFDTIYTTNFDDLINDSFYQFGQDRPILCAHDSSVKSLSTHTERPKIIKLHGDYLYDGIKSTNIETNTLEKNTEAKFREFSKDFGLIVLGYAGNDDSVMKCIERLLEDSEADFFENGIYWCIRRGDRISEKLSNLLNNYDKVFIVEIDGFDEFMAKVNSTVKNDISILNEFNETKKDKIINSFVTDKYNLRNNEIINKDITSLKKKNTQKDILEYIIDFNNNDSLNTSINDSEFKTLLNIDKSIKAEDFPNAKSSCLRILNDDISIDFRKKVLERLISINKLLGCDYELDAIRYADELIKTDEYESKYLICKAFLYSDLVKRIDALMEGYDKYKNEPLYLNTLGECIIDTLEEKINSPYTLVKAIEIIEKSLLLNPSINNKANLLLLSCYSIESKLKKNKNDEKITEKAQRHIDKFKLNNSHVEFFKMKLHNFVHEDTTCYSKQIICDMLEVRLVSNSKKRDSLEKLISKSLLSLHLRKGKDYKSDFGYFIKSNDFFNSNSVHFLFSRLYFFSYIELDKNYSYDLINKLKSEEESYPYYDKIIDIYCDIFNSTEDAKLYLEFIKKNISQSEYYKSLSNLAILDGDMASAIKYIDTAYLRGMTESEYSISKSFIFLVFKKYEEAITLVNNSNIDEDSSDILEINKQFSLKRLNKPIDESKLNEIISKSGKSKGASQSFELTSNKWICANIILDKNKQYIRHITDNISHDPALQYCYNNWPIIDFDINEKKNLKVAS
ncbi:SIR2 family protein [Vibrio splendidus]|uniref:SIR2 family protein n=1 Tax=Vibrio splendidus TaxID=29497 RepID=UPI000808EE89|nr:SIR2 family protein [Vibrio splendidus]SBS62946.1 hypothetical protein VHE8714_01476 [Vibrio splendidus]